MWQTGAAMFRVRKEVCRRATDEEGGLAKRRKVKKIGPHQKLKTVQKQRRLNQFLSRNVPLFKISNPFFLDL